MKPYWTMFRMQWLLLLQYRTAAIASLFTASVFGMYLSMAMEIFYRGGAAQAMTLSHAVSYIWLGQITLELLPWRADNEIVDTIRSGQVGVELCRPVDLYWMWYARSMARRMAPFLMRGIPVFVVSALLPAPFRLMLPSWAGVGAWVLSLLGAWVLAGAVTNIFYATAFRTVTADGVKRLFPAIIYLLAGKAIPLPLFPDWMQKFMRLQPFSGLNDLPNQLFIGTLGPENVIWVLALQLGWAAVFMVIGRTLTRRGLKRVEVAGG